MIVAIILIIASLVALLTILLVGVRGRGQAVADLSELEGRTRPVDLAAFRNLVDPDEEEYLRANLPPPDFRSIRRERLRAAIEYLGCVSENAAVLLRLGEAARRSDELEIAQAGQELVNSALYLRLYVLLASMKLRVGIYLPGVKLAGDRVFDRYEHVTVSVGRLGLLQNYPRSRRVAAIL
jgi:hypothetical protein